MARSEIRLKDFYQAVVLKTLGYPLLRLERGDEKFVYFVFNDPGNSVKEALDNYWSGKARADIRSVIENIRELKSRLYSEEGRG